MIYLLDTDYVTLDQHGYAPVSARIRLAGQAQVAISIITVEEQMRGWLAVIRRATTPDKRSAAYLQLRTAVAYFATFTLLDYTLDVDALVAKLRGQGVRIGTQDLRIAAIALTQHRPQERRQAYRGAWPARIVETILAPRASSPGLQRSGARRCAIAGRASASPVLCAQ